MKGDIDFEAEEEDEVADLWQDANTAISITSTNIIVSTVLTPTDFIPKVVVQQ